MIGRIYARIWATVATTNIRDFEKISGIKMVKLQ
jgi:hypothetical protein